jgi:serine phosphatase RsbU (regulator of sigma subunit)/Tfp pilus assembly protein PilF
MPKIKDILILILFPFLLQIYLPAYCSRTDSLIHALEESTDSNKYKIYEALYLSLENNPDSALMYINGAFELAGEENNIDQKAFFHGLKGHLYERLGNTNKAVQEFKSAYELYLSNQNIDHATQALQNMAAMLVDDGKFNEASKHLFNALRLTEEYNLKDLQGSVLTNIGLLFFNQNEWDKSIEYYQRSLTIQKETNDLAGLALLYNNLGISFYYKNMLDSVLVNFERSLDMYVKLDNKLGQTRPLSNIGEIYFIKGEYDKAFEYFNRSLQIENELGYKSGYAVSLMEIGDLYTELGEYKTALDYQYQGMSIILTLGAPAKIMDAYKYLYGTYSKMDNADSALKYFKRYTEIKDSIFTIEKTNHINELDKIYETEKKEQQIAMQKIKLRNHKIQVWTLFIILLLVIGIIIQILRINRNKKRSNQLLEKKNKMLAENNLQITNSITYASFIQAAILPPEILFSKNFQEYFLLFKPKDIVNGDFYWVTRLKELVFVAIADCTGHGVPGALMSMLGISYLKEIINTQKVKSTNKILDLLKTKIVGALRQKESTHDTRDGMDISLCVFNTTTLTMEYSGAYRTILIFSQDKMTIIEGDKMPIGYHRTRNYPFSKKECQLSKGDIIYLYTDGFADQFGGEKGNKYTRPQFRDYLTSIHTLPLEEQGKRLEEELRSWQGTRDQIDDITVLGVKI